LPHADFVHLRVHSAYSLAEGAIKVKKLIDLCKKNGMPAVALADTNNLFGAMEFAGAAIEAGVQPVMASQVSVRRPETLGGQAGRADQLVLIAQNETGWRNLMKIVSKVHIDSVNAPEPEIPFGALSGRSEGIICLTGGIAGPIGQLLLAGQKAQAAEMLEKLKGLFPGRIYMEIQRHGMEAEERLEPQFLSLAYAHDVPLVATNECFFTDAAMHEAHDVLLCIAEGAVLPQAGRRKVTKEHYFKSAAEMRALFADLPEAADNTLVIAKRCCYLLKPINPIMPAFPTENGRSEEEEMRAQAHEGLTQRLEKLVFKPSMTADEKAAAEKTYRDRLDFELGVIAKMKFPGYFLIVSDFIKWAKANNIPVGPGRGSGAGSVVAWSLFITDIDPFPFNLLFERFLNPERVSLPDFDIDFCQTRRGEVIRYVQRKYGNDRVAQIVTFGKLQARAVLRDVGRVLEMPYGQVDRICKMVPNAPSDPLTIHDLLSGKPEKDGSLRPPDPAIVKVYEEDEAVRRLMDIGMQLEGLYRHASTHAAGVVIAVRPLDEMAPLYRDPGSDMPVTQYNMKYVEGAGLVKFDFLGLKTLTVIQQATDMMAERGIHVDLSTLPLDDKKTYDMLAKGEAIGVFQFESQGMRDYLRKMKASCFEDLIALGALYRPGPIANIPTYINRKFGVEKPDYLHPMLQPVLQETYGIMVYQEQVMQIGQVLAGYSLGGADLLRRAMGKKKPEEMAAQRVRFVEGAKAKNVDEAKATHIFDLMEKFANYGFNKSHATAYALVSYQTAWLKANYPADYMAALMTLDSGNTDKLGVFRQEVLHMGIRLVPPDINRSLSGFSVAEGKDGRHEILYALAAVKGVGQMATDGIVAERKKNGKFKDIADFARRTDPRLVNRRTLEHLVFAGAFDSICPSRAKMLASVDAILKVAHATATEAESGQVSLFGGGASAAVPLPPVPQVVEWTAQEKLSHEMEAIGFYLSAHPLDEVSRALGRLGAVPSAQLRSHLRRSESSRLSMAGVVVGSRVRTSQKGSKYAFVQLSDTSGIYEVTVFSEVLAARRELLETGKTVFMQVDSQVQEEGIRLTVSSMEPLADAVARTAVGLCISLGDERPVAGIREAVAALQKGRGKLRLVVPVGEGREAELDIPGGYAFTPAMKAAVSVLPGVAEVEEL